MKSKRQQFIEYVRQGGERRVCSPQIGAGAGYDSKVVGKEWISQTTVADTLSVVARYDILPLINIGLCDMAEINPALAWRETWREETPERKSWREELVTPKGTLTRALVDEKHGGGFMPKYPVEMAEELAVLEWYLDAALDGDFSAVERHVRKHRELVGEAGVLDVQWAVQPYEIWCFPTTVTTAMLAMLAPEAFARLMAQVQRLNERLFKAVAKGGADFIFLGGPASEMISPMYYDNYIIPGSQEATALAHTEGLLVYSHICSPIEPFLSMGYYNKMGIDLFETLSPPPVGNVKSLADAMSKLDPAICTRGNLGLDVLLQGTPEVVREQTLAMIEQTQGRKHMIAASDYLFYDTPEANVVAMVETVTEFNRAACLK